MIFCSSQTISPDTAEPLDKPFTFHFGPYCLRLFVYLSVVAHCVRFFGSYLSNRNQLMRILNGNHKPFRKLLNPDGVMGKNRATALGSLDCDIIALTETHLSNDSMKLARDRFTGYNSFWGAPVEGKNAGVRFLTRSKSFWHVIPVTWPNSSLCSRHFQSGRSRAVSVFLGKGSSQFLIYCVYGIAGSRHRQNTKKRLMSSCKMFVQISPLKDFQHYSVVILTCPAYGIATFQGLVSFFLFEGQAKALFSVLFHKDFPMDTVSAAV